MSADAHTGGAPIGGAPIGQAPTALAPHHLRLFALIVDYLLAVGLLNLGHRVLLGAGWDLRVEPVDSLQTGWLLGGAALLLLRDIPGSLSPGKWFAGIAVARAADPALAPPLWRRALRNVTLPLLPLEAVWVFVDPYYRRLGDRLAGTVVVTQTRPAPVLRRLMGLAVLFLASTLAIFLLEFWNVRRSAAYPLALRLAAADAGVAVAFGDGVAFSAPGLVLAADGQGMIVQLHAEGALGEGRVEVRLQRGGDPPAWEPVGVDVHGPPPRTPPVRDAPPR